MNNKDKLKELIDKSLVLENYLLSNIRNEVNYIINNEITDINYIEDVLDQLLNICFTDVSKEFFTLCNYYKSINSEYSLEYIKIYNQYRGNNE